MSNRKTEDVIGADSETSDLLCRNTLLTGWGRTAPTRATVCNPTGAHQIRRVLVSRPERGIIARGLGRSYGDPAQNAGGIALDLTRLNAIHDVDLPKNTVTVDAGISLDQLMRTLVPLGLFVPVSPGTRFVTVGGAIACDIHGKNHHLDRSFSNHVHSFDLMTPDGEVRTVTPDGDPDAFRATAGGMGLTGIILRATLRMIPVETAYVSVDTERATDLDDVMSRLVARDQHYQYSVAWVDTLARGSSLGRSVLYQGNHTPLSELPTSKSRRPRQFAPSERLSVPDLVPSGLIRTTTVQLFNEFWYRRHPKLERGRIQHLTGFFHQLDMVLNANRLYGSSGFLQWQCVLPTGQEEVLRVIFERLSESRCPTFLVVLKRMGAGNGMLSFPIEGWTLAVDIPTDWPGIAGFLDELDDLVVDAGGRIYLAKDSRMRACLVPEMYPEINHWRDVVQKLDPDAMMQSDLARRLNLRGD